MNRNNTHNRHQFASELDVPYHDTPSPEEEEEPPPQELLLRHSLFKRLPIHSSETSPAHQRTNRAGLKTVTLIRALPRYAFSLPAQVRKAPISASKSSVVFRIIHFPTTSQDEWDNWKWQLANRITTRQGIERILQLSPDEAEALQKGGVFMPFAITPYYASLLSKNDFSQPLRRAVIPVVSELRKSPEEAVDPLGEDADSPVPGIIHRYPDRVLFLVTGFCSVNCRYCTRSRIVGGHGQQTGPAFWEEAIRYIERTGSIRDVLLSGGDPLTLSDEGLKYLLGRIRHIPHVEVIRIGTKVPVVLPQRITARLVHMLRGFHPLWMSIHFTHPEELTPEVYEACARLADAGLPLGSQTVLLRGINDDAETMGRLCQGLMRARVRPYYIYQCDPIVGSAHFRTPVERGVEIIRSLRGFTSGYAIPQFVIDAPGGGGKIPINPDYVVGRDGDDLILRNYEGRLYRYPDPSGGSTRTT
jgi:lysine 2,3-aminomutase